MDISKVSERIKANFPKAAQSTLEWQQISKYSLRSTDLTFTVGKVCVNNIWYYEAWMGSTNLAFRLKSADEAKALCESHALNLSTETLGNTVPAVKQKRSKADEVVK